MKHQVKISTGANPACDIKWQVLSSNCSDGVGMRCGGGGALLTCPRQFPVEEPVAS